MELGPHLHAGVALILPRLTLAAFPAPSMHRYFF